MPEYAALETNVVAATTIASVLITDPFTITNIQPNTPIAGRATVTFSPAHPHPPYYNNRFLKISGVTGLGSSWNAVYETRPAGEGAASTTTTVIIQSSNATAYTSGGIIRETTNRSINFFPNGEDPFVNLGGTLDLNNTFGPLEIGAKFRLLDNAVPLTNGQLSIAELVQVHNDPITTSLNFVRGRGTFNSTTSVQVNDMLGLISFTAVDGVNGLNVNGYPIPPSAVIFATAAETPPGINGSPGTAGILKLSTAQPGAGYNLTDAIIISQYQTVSIPARVEVSSTIRIEGNLISTINSNANLDIRTNGTGEINLLENVNVTGILDVPTLNVSTIDTNDSSAINFTPAVIFNSDVTVQNDLVVDNKVYADEFVSTGLGSAEISTTADFKIKVTNKEFGFNISGTFKLPVLSAAPVSPASGMVAVADGVGWDPLSAAGKEQMVVYLGGGWRAIAQEP
jgi:cytoskeletal protein CcmA (bactofilin family)